MTILIDLTIRSSVVLAAGLLLTWCLARRSAALRHRVLVATLLTAMVVIPVSLVMPAWSVTLPAFGSTPSAAPPVDATAAVSTSATFDTPAPATVSPILIALMAWIGGALVASLALATGLVRVGRVAARASRVRDAAWVQILGEVAGRYGLTRGIAIAQTDSEDLLATWGLLRPEVLVPRHAREWAPERVRVVLGHELAHIRRLDWIVQMGAEALRALLWFNPLMWLVCTRLRAESEQACDDEVLGLGVGGSSYAAHLLELARQCRRPRSAWVIGAADGPPVHSREEDCRDVEPATRSTGAVPARHGHARPGPRSRGRCPPPRCARVRVGPRSSPERSSTSPVPYCRGSK